METYERIFDSFEDKRFWRTREGSLILLDIEIH